MKIVSSTVAMEGRSSHVSEESQVTTLRVWDRRNNGRNGSATAAPGRPVQGDRLILSSDGLSLAHLTQLQAQARTEQAAAFEVPVPISDPDLTDVADKDGLYLEDALSQEDIRKIRLLEKLIEGLTGKKFKFKYFSLKEFQKALDSKPIPYPNSVQIFTATASPQKVPGRPEPVGWGLHFHQETTQYQKETVDFSSKGSIVTADGRSIDFQLNYHFSQEIYASSSIDLKAGDALIDPLVIRLDDSSLDFSDEPIEFDLDIDGINDAFRVPIDSAGLLFFDRNGNQVADDGSELFGPASGKGFEELAALDSDQNGWLDESDIAFDQLRIWIRKSDGSQDYLGLVEAGVGALFVGGVRTEASLYGSDLSQVGQMKMSSFYLKENGQPGLVHELDFKV